MAKIFCKSSYLLRRDTAENWSAKNPILREGEEGYETDTGRRKVGDGTTEWNNLKYDSGIVDQTYSPESENAQSGVAVAEALKTVNVDLSNYYTKEETDNIIGEMPTSDNWCVIANTTLTENIGSEKALQKFFEVTTDINGNPLAEKNIRHLRMTFYFPTSEDALYNYFRVRMSETAANMVTIGCAADSYCGCQIDVVNENAAFVIKAAGVKSYNDGNFILAGDTIREKSNQFGGKDKIEGIYFYTNYPNGTILPVGTKIMITGW